MDWIVLQGVKPYDGRYELDGDREFTTREWGYIKRLTGYLPLTVQDAFAGGDPELFAVLAVIALRRAGRIESAQVPEVFERIADAPFGTTITVEADQEAEEDDAGPPTQNSNSSTPTSGDGSATSSERSEPTPPNTGTPASDTSALGSMTLVT